MKRTRGITLFETLLASAVVLMVAGGATSLIIQGMRSFNMTYQQTAVSQEVSDALQYMNRDLEEAKAVTLVSATRIQIYYPKTLADGSFDRSILNAATYTEYYLATSNGTYSSTGTYLVRKVSNKNYQRLCAGVSSLVFTSPSPGSMDVSLSATGNNGASFQMVHRAIYLRNY
ncbi:hypothetical protein BH11ARM1_BH11ARM1_02540 [soil metagenome]